MRIQQMQDTHDFILCVTDGDINERDVNRDVSSTSLTPDVTATAPRLDDSGMTIKKG